MIEVHVTGGILSEAEQQAYVRRAEEMYADRLPDAMHIHVDGDYVDIDYTFRGQKFDRIRRITGYLVGTLDRFNNAKRAEERDRLKHGIGMQ